MVFYWAFRIWFNTKSRQANGEIWDFLEKFKQKIFSRDKSEKCFKKKLLQNLSGKNREIEKHGTKIWTILNPIFIAETNNIFSQFF